MWVPFCRCDLLMSTSSFDEGLARHDAFSRMVYAKSTLIEFEHVVKGFFAVDLNELGDNR